MAADLHDAILAVLTARMFAGRCELPLPRPATVVDHVAACQSILSSEPSLLSLSGDFTIVGDIHGNIDDLLRILEKSGYPPSSRFVFLGDYVDRGCNSVEVMIMLVALKVLFPSHVYLVRGNHECDSICSFFGFREECEMKLGTEVYQAFIECFAHLPFAAVINDRVFCCHGGIAPEVERLEQIRSLARPMLSDDSLVSNGLVWSDPKEMEDGWKENDRGTGYWFNREKLGEFLKRNELKMLVRSHESCQKGYEWVFGEDGGCLTVFSNSDYCGIGNDAAIVKLNADCEITIELLEPLSQLDGQKRRVLIPEWMLEITEGTQADVCPLVQFGDDTELLNVFCDEAMNSFSEL